MLPWAESFNQTTAYSTVIRCQPTFIRFNWFGCWMATTSCYLPIDPWSRRRGCDEPPRLLELEHALAEVPDSFGAGDSTPRTTPPAVPAPSHGKTAPTPSADPGHHPTDMDVAQDRSNTDTLLGCVDDYFNEHGGCDMEELFGPASQEPNLGAKTLT